jgi:nucleoid-associated protein YgaU
MTRARLVAQSVWALAILALAAAAGAQTYELTPYKIQKGDTLWGIAGTHMKDSFQWPLIWRENPAIKNPDRIKPGQDLMLPLSLVPPQSIEESKPSAGEKETGAGEAVAGEKAAPEAVSNAPAVTEAPKTVMLTPVKINYPFTEYEIIQSGYITPKIPVAGEVYASVNERELIAKGDEVYLKTKEPASVGDQFMVIRAAKINHPVTGENLGYLVEPLGTLEVKSFKDHLVRAAVTDAFEQIGKGDIIIRYTEPEMPIDFESRKPRVNGYVVAIRRSRIEAGESDIVYLDKGRADGIGFGDLLATVKGPDINATLQVIRVEDHSATAVIRKSSLPVNAGDPVTGAM